MSSIVIVQELFKTIDNKQRFIPKCKKGRDGWVVEFSLRPESELDNTKARSFYVSFFTFSRAEAAGRRHDDIATA